MASPAFGGVRKNITNPTHVSFRARASALVLMCLAADQAGLKKAGVVAVGSGVQVIFGTT